jgi:hypothetical protein
MASSKHLRKVKRLAQRIHFARRASERLGYELSGAEVIDIRRQVQAGTGELLTRPSDRLVLYRISANGRGMIVVYDNETEELVTMLTEEIWQAQRMFKSPGVNDKADLRESLGGTAWKELSKLKKI